MLNRFFRALTKNLGLKVLSVIFAVVLWLIVENVEDPKITRTFSVDVTFEDSSILDAKDKVYYATDSESVRVVLTAKRSVMGNISASDIRAVIDFSDITDEDPEGVYDLEVYLTMERYQSQVDFDSGTKYIRVTVEDKAVTKLPIEVGTTGQCAAGYVLDKAEAQPSKVRVEGPKSIISTIASAVVSCDITEMYEETTVKSDIVLLNESGNTVESDLITLNMDKVDVNLSFNMIKTVAVSTQPKGSLPSGYELGDITLSPDHVSVSGKDSIIGDLTSVSIPSSMIVLTNKHESFEVKVDMAKLLPDGVELAEDQDGEVTVYVEIKKTEEGTDDDLAGEDRTSSSGDAGE